MASIRIIGISLGHDAGVAVVENDKVLFAANEERYSRVKGSSGVPHKAISAAAKYGPFDVAGVDGSVVAPHGNHAAYEWASTEGLQALAQRIGPISGLLGHRMGTKLVRVFFRLAHTFARAKQNKLIRDLTGAKTVSRVDHHLAHGFALPAEAISSNGTSLVLTIDGIGEGICSRAYIASDGELREINWIPALGSPALMYGYATKALGFRTNRHEGKLTGLAAWGDSTALKGQLSKHWKFDPGRLTFELSSRIGYGVVAVENFRKLIVGHSREDVSAGVQAVAEEMTIELIQELHRLHDFSQVAVSGGLFANVKLNQRIAKLPFVRKLTVCPNMGDGGLALGVASALNGKLSNYADVFLGEDIGGIQCLSATVPNSVKVQLKPEPELVSSVAKILSEKKFLAIARGRMEWGPRALCNRSILFDASSKRMAEELNARLKRSDFMPFAPVVRDENAEMLFHLDGPLEQYEFMTVTAECTEETRRNYAAIVHVDGTARPQVVTRRSNPFAYAVLLAYEEMTGKKLLVNTSFNLHEDPIVNNSDEALRTFMDAPLDALVLGGALITWRNNESGEEGRLGDQPRRSV